MSLLCVVQERLISPGQRCQSHCFPSVAWADALTQSLYFTGDQSRMFLPAAEPLPALSCLLQVSAAGPKQSSLQPCPPEVVFQNYTPGEVYEVPVVLRNRDKVSAGTWRFNTAGRGECRRVVKDGTRPCPPVSTSGKIIIPCVSRRFLMW